MLEVLSQEQVNQIHEATLKVLEETGCAVKDEEALEIFRSAGAQVDRRRQIVRIPRQLVEKALKSSPKRLTLYGRQGSKVELGVGKTYFMGGYGTVNVLDWKTGKSRPNRKQDLLNYARVAGRMEHNAIYYNEVTASDVPPGLLDRHNAEVVLQYVEKPCFLEAFSLEGLADVISMVKAACGPGWQERPTACIQLCAITPLVLDELRTRLLVEVARQGLPIVYGTLPQAGGTSPVTLAGTLVVQMAETLGGLTLAQLVRPGTPFLLNNFAAVMDMRFALFASGGPEMALMQAGTAQLCRFYKMFQIGTAGSTEANSLDVQAGYEKGISILYAALSGVEMIHGAISGWVQNLLTHCLAQVVVSDEICGYVSRILKGIEVSEATLALDAIREAGPGGNFLMHPSTMEHLLAEHWQPPVSRRLNAKQWEAQSYPQVLDHAQEKVDRILGEDPVFYIDQAARDELHEIVEKADRKLGVKA